MNAMPWALVLAGCRPDPTPSKDSGPPPSTELTDGLPQFVGYRPKNLLFISMDTFRKDHMARWGGDPEWAPFLDELTSQSYVLDAHQSCSNWTAAGVLCLVDGKSNLDLGYLPRLIGGSDAPERTTLASTLGQAGYHSVLETANGWLTKLNVPFGYELVEEPTSDYGWNIYQDGRDHLLSMTALDGKPWFLHVHIKEPHVPYDPPADYLAGLDGLPPVDYDFTDQADHYAMTYDWATMDEKEKALILETLLVRYRGEIRWMDDQLRNMWTDLEEKGMLDDTLVVFWTDHGEQFWEHGQQTHAYSLHNEENNSFVLLWAKNIVPGNWTEPTWHPDIAPTVLKAIGVDVPSDMNGIPVGEAPADRALITDTVGREGPLFAVTKEGLRLHYDWDGAKEFYDLNTDPLETDNVYDSTDPRVVALWDLLTPAVQRAIPLVDGWGDPVDPGP